MFWQLFWHCFLSWHCLLHVSVSETLSPSHRLKQQFCNVNKRRGQWVRLMSVYVTCGKKNQGWWTSAASQLQLVNENLCFYFGAPNRAEFFKLNYIRIIQQALHSISQFFPLTIIQIFNKHIYASTARKSLHFSYSCQIQDFCIFLCLGFSVRGKKRVNNQNYVMLWGALCIHFQDDATPRLLSQILPYLVYVACTMWNIRFLSEKRHKEKLHIHEPTWQSFMAPCLQITFSFQRIFHILSPKYRLF